MSMIDKAKEAAEMVADKAKESVEKVQDQALGDDFLAAFIMKYAAKQEHINEILESEGSNYRIGGLEVEAGVPPKAVFVVEKRSG